MLATLAEALPAGGTGRSRSNGTATGPSPGCAAATSSSGAGAAGSGGALRAGAPAPARPSAPELRPGRRGVPLDEDGRPRFGLLQRGAGTMVYYVFDLLEADGERLLERPWRERRARLRELLVAGDPVVRLSEDFADGVALRDAAERQGSRASWPSGSTSRTGPAAGARTGQEEGAPRAGVRDRRLHRGQGHPRGHRGARARRPRRRGARVRGQRGQWLHRGRAAAPARPAGPARADGLALRARCAPAETRPRARDLGGAAPGLPGRVRRVDRRRAAARPGVPGPARRRRSRERASRSARRPRPTRRRAATCGSPTATRCSSPTRASPRATWSTTTAPWPPPWCPICATGPSR